MALLPLAGRERWVRSPRTISAIISTTIPALMAMEITTSTPSGRYGSQIGLDQARFPLASTIVTRQYDPANPSTSNVASVSGSPCC